MPLQLLRGSATNAKPIMKYAYFSKKPGSLILPLWFWTQDASPTHHTGGRTVEGSRPGDRYMISHGMPEWNWRTWDVTWSTWSWVKSVKGDNRCWISTIYIYIYIYTYGHPSHQGLPWVFFRGICSRKTFILLSSFLCDLHTTTQVRYSLILVFLQFLNCHLVTPHPKTPRLPSLQSKVAFVDELGWIRVMFVQKIVHFFHWDVVLQHNHMETLE